MIGIDSYTATKESLVGIDWLNLASGGLKTAGGAAASLSKPTPGTPTPDDVAKKDAADKKAAANAPMPLWQKAGIAIVLALGGWYGWKHFHKKK